jgi:hypothetical protein
MTFGLSTRLFIENGPVAQSEVAAAGHTTARTWRILDADRRLALIEHALEPANDRIDRFPVAL